MLLVTGGSRPSSVSPILGPVLGNSKTTCSLARELSVRTIRCWFGWDCIVATGLTFLVHQHLTSTSAWPNCEFTSQSLANPSQAALRSHRPHMVHHSGNKVTPCPHPCQRVFQLCCKQTTDVSIRKVETESAILPEPSQDGKRALLLPELSWVGQSTARNRTCVTCKACFFSRALLLRGRPSALVHALRIWPARWPPSFQNSHVASSGG
jgi:hypothetical protein